MQEEYEQYTAHDVKSVEDKLRLMKNKIEQYELKLADRDIIDVIEKHGKLSQSEDNRAFAEFKSTVEALKQEIAIAKARNAIELEDLRKQADYLEMQKIKGTTKQKDVEVELDKVRDFNLKMHKELEETDQRIILKKRYVMHQF